MVSFAVDERRNDAEKQLICVFSIKLYIHDIHEMAKV